MNKLKHLFLMVLMIVSILAVGQSAVAENGGLAINIISVEVDGTDLLVDDTISGVERDNTIEFEIKFKALADLDNIGIEVELTGDGHKDEVRDSTDEFDIHNGTTYDKKLELELPQRMDKDRKYQVRVTISNKHDYMLVTGTLDIASTEHSIQIRDIVLSPENTVKAGRALLASARVKNRGESVEEDLKVKVSMPELGISASDYIDKLDPEDCDEDVCDDSTSSEEIYLRIPDCAEAGEYTVKVCVEYDDGDEEECEITTIEIVEGDVCPSVAPSGEDTQESKTIITIGPEMQDIEAGKSVVYSVTLANQGSESKAYTITSDAAWAEVSMTPTNVVVLSPGESKSVFVNVQAKEDAPAGEQMFAVTIESGNKVLKQVPLKANVKGAEESSSALGSVKRGLEIGLIILVLLLVIIGLIIGFSKLRGSDEEKEEQTYY